MGEPTNTVRGDSEQLSLVFACHSSETVNAIKARILSQTVFMDLYLQKVTPRDMVVPTYYLSIEEAEAGGSRTVFLNLPNAVMVPYIVVTPNHKIVSLILYSCHISRLYPVGDSSFVFLYRDNPDTYRCFPLRYLGRGCSPAGEC